MNAENTTLYPEYFAELRLAKTLGYDADSVNPEKLSSGESNETIRASFFRKALLNAPKDNSNKPCVVSDTIFLGSICLCNCVITRDIELDGCVIFGSLCADKSKLCSVSLRGSKVHSLSLMGAKLSGNLILSYNFTSYGKVSLQQIRIYGQLGCTGGKFLDSKFSLSLEGGVVEDIFFWRQVIHIDGKVDLTKATVDTLVDDENSWPSVGKLSLDGFKYSSFASNTRVNHYERRKWILKQSSEHLTWGLRPQPFAQLIKVLEMEGLRKEAVDVRILFEDLKRKNVYLKRVKRHLFYSTNIIFQNKIIDQINPKVDTNLLDKAVLEILAMLGVVLGGLNKILSGYGYKPFRVILWCILTIVSCAFMYDHILSLNGNVDVSERVSLLIYSLDVFLPVVDLGEVQALKTSVAIDDVEMVVFRRIAQFQKLSGWIALVYLGQSIARLVKN